MSEFKQIPDVVDIPGNAKELSDLMESDKVLEEEILYLSGGVESYKNHNQRTRFPITVSIEEGGFELKRIIERILRYLGNMITDVFDGSAASAIALSQVYSRAEEILLHSRTARRSSQKPDFVIQTRIQNLSVKYRVIKDPQQLLQHLKVLNNVASDIYRYLTFGVFTCFNDLITFDPLKDDLEVLAQSVINSAPSTLSGNGRFQASGLQVLSPQLLGNQRVVIQNQRPDAGPLDRLLACNMYLDHAESEPRQMPNEVVFDKFGISLEQSILKEVVNTVKSIEQYNTINRRAMRRQRMEMVKGRIATLSASLEDVDIDEAMSNQIRTYIRVLEVYSGWMMSPYVGLIALTHRNLTAVLNVCEGNSK